MPFFKSRKQQELESLRQEQRRIRDSRVRWASALRLESERHKVAVQQAGHAERKKRRILRFFGKQKATTMRWMNRAIALETERDELAETVAQLHDQIVQGQDKKLHEQLDWYEKRIAALQADQTAEHERARADYFEQRAGYWWDEYLEARRELETERARVHEVMQQAYDNGKKAALQGPQQELGNVREQKERTDEDNEQLKKDVEELLLAKEHYMYEFQKARQELEKERCRTHDAMQQAHEVGKEEVRRGPLGR